MAVSEEIVSNLVENFSALSQNMTALVSALSSQNEKAHPTTINNIGNVSITPTTEVTKGKKRSPKCVLGLSMDASKEKKCEAAFHLLKQGFTQDQITLEIGASNRTIQPAWDLFRQQNEYNERCQLAYEQIKAEKENK